MWCGTTVVVPLAATCFLPSIFLPPGAWQTRDKRIPRNMTYFESEFRSGHCSPRFTACILLGHLWRCRVHAACPLQHIMEHQPPLQSMVSSSNNNSKNNHGSNHSNGKSAILSWTKNNNNHRPKKMTSPVRSQQPLPPCADTGKGKITLDRLSKAPLRALQYLMVMESNGNAHSPTSTIPVTSLGKGLGRGLPNILSPPSHSPRHVGATSSSGYPRKSRDPVRRCVSDDLDRPRAASGGGVLPGKNGTGLFSGMCFTFYI